MDRHFGPALDRCSVYALLRLVLGGRGVGCLLIAFAFRAAAARHLARKYRLPMDRHFPDCWPRRFACCCFFASILVIAPHTDRCTHGEYWELWRTLGIERDIAGGFCERHAAFSIHLRGPWHIYWRRGRWIG